MNKIILKKQRFGIFLFLLGVVCVTVPSIAYAQSTDTARTKIGNPTEASSGWPTTGTITQGPRGGSHGTSGLVALDIANAAGTPIYATFDGKARAFDCTNKGECDASRGRLGNYVMIIPTEYPNAEILFGHMLSVTIADNITVTKGQLIGYMGNTGYSFGDHLHYEFRRLPMTTPHIPVNVTPESCESGCTPRQIAAN